MKSKFFTLIIVLAMLVFVRQVTDAWIQPALSTQSALNATNGGALEFALARSVGAAFNALQFGLGLATLGCVVLLARSIAELFARRGWTLVVLAAACLGLASCKPYEVPEYVQVKNNETAFVIPLEDAKEKQDAQMRFNSEEFLDQAKVMTKRILVPHRWEQLGRVPWDGSWIPSVVVLKVDRSPVTREWNAQSAATKGTDKAIWIESGDSVGFCMGVTCTAFIQEQDSAKFLYMYPSGSLEATMDSEIRARIQKVAAEQAAKFPLDQLRERKVEIMTALETDVVPFFAKRVITITTIGMFGGMTYENPKIQASIDEVFVAQQLKNVALAQFDAQAKTNERTLLAAKADAEQITMKAAAESERRSVEAEGEAKAIQVVNQALANTNPTFIQLRTLEAQQKQIERWDGRFPTTFFGGATQPSLLLNVPPPK